MAVANGMRSVANARPTLCDMLPKELDTEIPAKPRRSISRAVSSVARRRPGSAIRLRAGKVADIDRRSFVRMSRSRLIIARYLRQGRYLKHHPPVTLYRLLVIPRCGRVDEQAYHVWGDEVCRHTFFAAN